MDLTNLTVFKAVTGRMNWLSRRQEVLAQNIANADTPGYVPSDLKEQDFSTYLPGKITTARLVHTDPQHINPQAIDRPPNPEKKKDVYEMSPSGNAVVLEEQLMNINAVQSDYRLATNLYAKHIAMIRTALGRGGT